MIAAASLSIAAAALMAPAQDVLVIEPGYSIPLDGPTIAYANGLLRDATAAVARREQTLTCLGYRGFPGSDSCDALRALFPLLDRRRLKVTFVGPCYGGSPNRCITFEYPRDRVSYISVDLRLEPSGVGPANALRMTSVEIREGEYSSD